VGAGRLEVGQGKRARGHADRPGAGGQRRLDVERGVADQDGRLATEVGAVAGRGVAPGHRDQVSADLALLAVGPRGQVEELGQPERVQLDLGHGPQVSGQGRLDDLDAGAARGHRGEGLAHAGQHAAVRGDLLRHGRRVPGQHGLELVEYVARLTDPGRQQDVHGDSPVGAPGHRHGHRRQVAGEHLLQRQLVKGRPDAPRAEQGVVDIPEHEHAAGHARRLSGRDFPAGSRRRARQRGARPGARD
jgi:hypothetical protein